MKKKIFLFYFLIFFIGCKNIPIEDSISKILFENNKIEDLENKIECIFIPLETTDENLMGNIKKAVILDDRIYVFDIYNDRILHVFDLKGKYITQIGNIGNGPGEYAGVFNFHILTDKEYIIIEDQLQNRLYFYNLFTYNYITHKNVPFNFSELILLDNDYYGWYSPIGYKNENRSYCLLVTDSTFQNRTYYLDTQFTSSYTFGGNFNFMTINEENLHYSFISPTIYHFTSKGVLPQYHVDVEGEMFPSQEFYKKEIHKEMGFVDNLINSDYISSYSLFETNKDLYLSYFLKKNFHIGIYNKETGNSYTYDYPTFVRDANLVGLSSPFAGTYNDYLICSFSSNVLKRRGSKRKELKEIIDNLNEEDNPVLCLLKIKE